MKPACLRYIFVFLLIISGLQAFSQQNYASNVHSEVSDDKVLISYDLNPKDGARFFDIIVMITHKGKQVQASSLYGDYGSKIGPGSEKAIVWFYKNDFKQNINEVEINVFAYQMNEPKAIFEIVSFTNNGYAPCEVVVVNKSAYANEYRWDFGDPASGIRNHSIEKEPRHLYEKGGPYTIALTARNTALNLESVFYQSFEIKQHDPVIAGFEFEVTGTKPPYEVRFRNTSKNANILAWNFGDPGASAKNNSSNKPNPSYKYRQAGKYTVELSVRNNVSGLTDKITREVSISAPELPTAGFVFTLSSESAPAIAVFKNTSTNASSWKWSFGDPASGAMNSSTEENPAHSYALPGNYEVELTATNPQTGKSSKFKAVVTVGEPPRPPVAGFKIENNNRIGPVTIIFTNTSSNANSYAWDFGNPDAGDNNSSAQATPTHTYTKPGRYTVTLRAINTKTGESNTFTDYVVVTEATRAPVAAFSIGSINPVAPATVKFTNSSANADSYLWGFGDPSSGASNRSSDSDPVHVYNRPGTYTITLTATNKATGATNQAKQTLKVAEPAKPPVAKFEIINNNATAPATLSFTNQSENGSQFEWNFGDPESGNNNTSTEANPQHTYRKPGQYKVTLKVTNSGTGLSNITEKTAMAGEPNLPPVADFTFELKGSFAPLDIAFTNSSVNADSYSWDFGDPKSKSNQSSGVNPTHRFENPGTYTIVLEARNSKSGLSKKISKEVLVPRKYPTYARSTGRTNNNEMATGLSKTGSDEYLVLVNEGQSGSAIIRLNGEGAQLSEKKLNTNLHAIAHKPGGGGYVLSGILSPAEIMLQLTDNQLGPAAPVLAHTNLNNPEAVFGITRVAVNAKGEIAVVANMSSSGEPFDIWFQKCNSNAQPLAPQVKVFRYIGAKTANSLIPDGDGFMVTGFWQQDKNSLKRLMLAYVDPTGKGEMNVLRSEVNITGCDLVVLPGGNYSVLTAKDCLDDNNFSELTMKLLDRKTTPLNCEIDLPGRIKTEDMHRFPPRVIKTDSGYIVLSHVYNGSDHDITLFWIDNDGRTLIRKEELKKAGDQFGTSLVAVSDGSLIITGAERVGNDLNALVIKTDPLGKVYELAGQ